MTEWRDVVGYEDLYEVSDEGHVMSKAVEVSSRPYRGRAYGRSARPVKMITGNTAGDVTMLLWKNAGAKTIRLVDILLAAFPEKTTAEIEAIAATHRDSSWVPTPGWVPFPPGEAPPPVERLPKALEARVMELYDAGVETFVIAHDLDQPFTRISYIVFKNLRKRKKRRKS